MSTELITWISAATLPDSDTTVLLFAQDASEPVWLGYFDGERWLYVDGMPARPSHWVEIAGGPEA